MKRAMLSNGVKDGNTFEKINKYLSLVKYLRRKDDNFTEIEKVFYQDLEQQFEVEKVINDKMYDLGILDFYTFVVYNAMLLHDEIIKLKQN